MPDFTQPLASADDETIEAAVELGLVPPLLAAVAGALDEPALPPEHLRPNLAVVMDPTFGMSDDQVAEGKALAVEAIKRMRDTGAGEVKALPVDHLRTLLDYVTGGGAE